MKTFRKAIYITFVIAIFISLLTSVTPVYAATAHTWNTKADFDAGVLNQVDTSFSPGDIVLGTNLDTGTGADGALNVTDGLYFIDTVKSAVTTTAYQGTDFIGVNTTNIFNTGDEVLIIQMDGTGAGNWETNHVDGAEEYVLVLHENLQHTYYAGGDNHAQVIRVPQYTDVTVSAGGILTCEFWNQFGDYTGGVMFFRATGTVTVENSGGIDITGRGSSGGTGGSSSHGGSGGSGGYAGGSSFGKPDGGDGGNRGHGGEGGDPGVSSDGLGGYYGGDGGLHGDSGSRNSGSSGDGPGGGAADHGGTNVSTADLSLMQLGGGGGGGTSGKGGEGGGGGGGGGSNTCGGLSQPKAGKDGGKGGSGGSGGTGGSGGGIIIMYANSIIANGFIKTDGSNGTDGSDGGNGGAGGKGGYGAKFCVVSCDDADCIMGGPGGGGGGGGGANGGNGGNSGAAGSGGTMWFAANSITISQGSVVEAIGGLGGDAGEGGDRGSGGSGGDGGEGDDTGANAKKGDHGPHGSAGTTGAIGGTGSTGEIRLDYCTLSGTTNPAPSYTSGLYYTSGTIASDVWDTGNPGETWQSLNWEATLHANSNISFEVRASDTSFAKDASSPAWVSVGSTSPVNSGLPSGRYMQWRATLTTNNTLYSPVLHSVTISYSSSPDVSTDTATGITANSAALNGNLLSMGTAAQANVSFEWGTTQGGPYPNSTPIQAMTAPGNFSANLSGLSPDTPYYFRAKADGGASGIDYGDEMSFTTSRVAPTVITKTAGNITANSAILNGNLHDMGTATTVNVSFEWGTTRGGPYPNSTSPQVKTLTGNYQANLSGLGPDTIYYYRAKADGGINGISYGTEVNFTTSMVPPSVITDSATSITANSATLNGDLSNTGTAATVNVYFQWGTTQGGPYPNSTPIQAMTAPGDFNANLTGLAGNTTYYFRAVGDGGAHGTSFGDEMSFTTLKIPPSVSTTGATNIEEASATLNGALNSLGTAPAVNVYFQWGTTQGGPYTESTSPQAKGSAGSFNAEINNLDGNTTYYFRAVGDGDTHGINYGSEKSFTTSKVPPSVSTDAATAVTADSATLNGNLHSLGTAPTVGVSFQYGTTSGVYSNETAVVDKNSPCDFQSDLAGLNPDTTYYYRAKANGGIHGTSYGDEEVFTTNGIPPSVTTGNATDLTTNSAMLTGNLDGLGTATTVDVSFRYGTSQGGPYPNSTTVQSMTTTGAFQIGVDGLVPLTTYYFIARADGGTQGIAYGAESSFHTGMFPPYVETLPADGITDTAATLHGNLLNLGSATTVNVYFVYGTTEGGPYPNSTTQQPKTVTGTFQADLSDLSPGTTYYYRSKGNGGEYGINTGDEMIFTTSIIPPSVTTNNAGGITASSATLNGNLDSLGDAATVNVSFQWGTSHGGPYNNETTPQAMTSTGTFNAGLSELDGDTTYYYRAKADGGTFGMSYGDELSFTTSKIPPEIYTDPATSVNPTTAVVNGYLSSIGTAPTVDVSFEYGTTQGGPYPNTTPVQTRNNTGYFGANITGLTPLTTYYFRALADGGTHGSDTGDELSFTTTATPPSVSTGSATAVTADSATLNGDLHSLGTAATVNVSFQWGTSPGVYNHETTPQSMDTAGNFDADLAGLNSDTTYYYRAKGDGGANGISFGTEHSFTTNTLPPTVTTDAATDMTTDFARLNGTLDVTGTADTVDVSFIYGTTSGGPYPYTTSPQSMSSAGDFDDFINGLSPHTTYYFKAKADGGIYGTSYGSEMNFTTNHLPPVVETGHASDIITNAATLNGSLYNLGSAPAVAVYFEYGTTQGGPYGNITPSEIMDTPGSFLADINGLTPETTYYFRAVADGGAAGTSYGEEQMFTTSFFPPEVITNNANNITAGSATLNGDLRFLGSATEVDVSFMYGTNHGGPYPFVTTPQAMTASGVFNAGITGLSANTAYYFKAKADAGIYGKSYGQEISFVTSAIPPAVTTGNAVDITGAGARLNGSLVNLGSGPSAQVSFQWGTASGVYPNETTPQLMTDTGDFQADITGLTWDRQYYYRARAIGDGTGYGEEQSFWTSGGKDGVETATGKGMAYFSSNAGTFQNLRAVSDTTLPSAGRPAGMSFLYGLFSFDIVDITPGSTVTITITLPGNVPTGTQYWDFINGQWVNLTSLMGHNDGDNILTLTITDGGLGDADGQVNGRISDPGGPANYYAGASTSNRLSSSSSSTPERTITMPANLSVKYLNVQPQRAQASQKVVIYANITNSGDETSSYVAELRINGQVEQLKTGNVNGHAAVPLQFEVMKDRSGTYTVDINGQQSYFTVSGETNGVETSRKVLQIALIFSAIAILSLAVLLIRRIKAD